ncbi:MAG: YbaB/EbfC family nucleoid-associated protein [Verrucomicrobiota bacterium]
MNMMKMMKQAQQMQAKMKEMQDELAAKEYEAEAGGGAVKAVATGSGELRSLKIDEDMLKEGDAEMVEDLVVTAVNEAINKGRDEMNAEMSKMTKGLGLPPGMM